MHVSVFYTDMYQTPDTYLFRQILDIKHIFVQLYIKHQTHLCSELSMMQTNIENEVTYFPTWIEVQGQDVLHEESFYHV